MMNGYKIKNYPEYANGYKYIVVRYVDDEMWFYGAYNDLMKANNVAGEINGIVNKNPNYKRI